MLPPFLLESSSPRPGLSCFQTAGGANGASFAEVEEGAGGAAPPPLRKRDIPTPIIATVSGERAGLRNR